MHATFVMLWLQVMQHVKRESDVAVHIIAVVRRSVRNPSSALSTATVQSSAKAAVCSSYSSSVSSNGSLVGRPLRHALSM